MLFSINQSVCGKQYYVRDFTFEEMSESLYHAIINFFSTVDKTKFFLPLHPLHLLPG